MIGVLFKDRWTCEPGQKDLNLLSILLQKKVKMAVIIPVLTLRLSGVCTIVNVSFDFGVHQPKCDLTLSSHSSAAAKHHKACTAARASAHGALARRAEFPGVCAQIRARHGRVTESFAQASLRHASLILNTAFHLLRNAASRRSRCHSKLT